MKKKIMISIIIICFIILCACYLYIRNHPLNAENQIRIFAVNVDEWNDHYTYTTHPFYITITDLNQDGKLELITATIEGTANYANNYYYTINNKNNELMRLQDNTGQGESSADIIHNIMYGGKEKENVPVYYDVKKDMYYSIHKDYTPSPVEGAKSIVSLTLDRDRIKEKGIAYARYERDDVSYWNYEKQELSEEEYEKMEKNTYPNLKKMEMTWKWHKVTREQITDMDQDKLRELLEDLYNNFAITDL